MKRLSFVITILGIFILLVLLNFQSPKIINRYEELSNLPDNTKVQTSGMVLSEKKYASTKIIILNNSLEINCKSCPSYPSYINRTITVTGIVKKYQNRPQIQALRLKHA
ncbi:MAG: hypothetical protein QXS38_00285 [Candidatus Pacearchaeota archaeon]